MLSKIQLIKSIRTRLIEMIVWQGDVDNQSWLWFQFNEWKTYNRFGWQWHRGFELKVLSQFSMRRFSTLMAIGSKFDLRKYNQSCTCSLFKHPESIARSELSPCTSMFSMTSNFVWIQRGRGGLNCTLFSICLWVAPTVERSNVSCKAWGQFWVQNADASWCDEISFCPDPLSPLASPCKGRRGIMGWSLNGLSTIPSTKVFWRIGLNKSTNNRNRKNKYQNQHLIDWCMDLLRKNFDRWKWLDGIYTFQQAGPIRILLHSIVQ